MNKPLEENLLDTQIRQNLLLHEELNACLAENERLRKALGDIAACEDLNTARAIAIVHLPKEQSPSNDECGNCNNQEHCKREYGICVRAASSAPAEQSLQAPIVRITVADNQITNATFYAPSLPDGTHDLYCEPLST